MNNFFLDLHERCIEAGQLPRACGLCIEIGGINTPEEVKNVFALLEQTDDDYWQLNKRKLGVAYWGSDLPINAPGDSYLYTPLRQTILLLCHEILNS